MSFDLVYPHTKKFEGGYANDPVDRGGETFRGISRRHHPAWPGWPLIDAAKRSGLISVQVIDGHFADNLEMARLVESFYHQNFYHPMLRFTDRPRPVAKLFDAGVNLGVGGAVRLAQRIVETTADGVIGPLTQAAAMSFFSRRGEQEFIELFCVAQIQHYLTLAKNDPSQERFINGWIRRGLWQPLFGLSEA